MDGGFSTLLLGEHAALQVSAPTAGTLAPPQQSPVLARHVRLITGGQQDLHVELVSDACA